MRRLKKLLILLALLGCDKAEDTTIRMEPLCKWTKVSTVMEMTSTIASFGFDGPMEPINPPLEVKQGDCVAADLKARTLKIVPLSECVNTCENL